VLAGLWTGEPFAHQGRHYQIASRGLRPRPLQRPHPPLWVAAQAAEGILWAAEHGAGWMFVLPPGQTIEGWQPARDLYLEKVEAAGGTPRIYLHVPTYVARRPVAQVRSETEPWIRWWLEAVGEGETIWNRGGAGVRQGAVDHMFQYGYFGGPEELLRQIERYAEFGVTDFTFHVTFGPPRDRVRESMEVLARWVLPEARRLVGSGDRHPVGGIG
jgi:alkanesulfonate monooxygenase SsuD/methylene tetrahydromethanopterin reductase-like flavin-dependent oxidoreductase (luciferase family)